LFLFARNVMASSADSVHGRAVTKDEGFNIVNATITKGVPVAKQAHINRMRPFVS